MTAPRQRAGFDPELVSARVAEVRERIGVAGGDPVRVRLVAVTKGFGIDAVRATLAAGVSDIGESYAQELVAKASQISTGPEPGVTPPRWHFVGRLQVNKIRQLVGRVELWHSVDRARAGNELSRRSPGAEVLVQVNVSETQTQGGCPPDDVAVLVAELREQGLAVRGLMTIGARSDDEAARRGFAQLRALADRLDLAECSMGMSHDFEAAVAEGSTMVRIGRALFGERPDGTNPRNRPDHPRD